MICCKLSSGITSNLIGLRINMTHNTGSKPLRRTSLWAFHDYTMVWEWMSARQATPCHKFRIWKSLLARTLAAYLLEKNCGCESRLKKLQPTCANRAANPDLPVI